MPTSFRTPAFFYSAAKQADKPDSVHAPRRSTARVAAIPLGAPLLTRSSFLPADETGGPACISKMRACLFGIAAGGGYRAGLPRSSRGALLPHRFTLT